jgi:hypothetical protein
MRHLKRLHLAAMLVLANALASSVVSAQEADTLSISGTFNVYYAQPVGALGDDLAEVYFYALASQPVHTWTLTLRGLSYSYDHVEVHDEWGIYSEDYITRVHATSFDFEFFGPDADVLNAAVSGQLTGGSLSGGAFLELLNHYDAGYDGGGSGWVSLFFVGLQPLDRSTGVSFYVDGRVLDGFPAGEYPVVEPRDGIVNYLRISDFRPGNSGALQSLSGVVRIGSPPPPASPTLSIADGSVREGKRGTTRLDLTVTLSGSSSDTVTVNYATASGTAIATSDYTATSGTLTFQPGDTSRTISVSIKGDRKREPNETFSVQLSNAAGASIDDGVATATILNDD